MHRTARARKRWAPRAPECAARGRVDRCL